MFHENTTGSATVRSKKYFIFIVIFLGMMSAFGPFVTDMYLPTLPSMTETFHTSMPMVQLGLTTAMVGLAVGQVFFGPISDKYGRRLVLIISMVLFSIAALASVFSPDIKFFLCCRFAQGLGGSGGIVLSRSIATDSYSGRELAKMMAIIGAVHGVAPVSAPVIGGLVSESIGWKGIFGILFAIGIILLIMSFRFRETLVPEKRVSGPISIMFRGYPHLARISAFVVPAAAFASVYGVLFGYISSAPFVIQSHYNHSELFFSIIFGVNATGIAIGSAISLKFRSLSHSLLTGSIIIFALSICQLICALTIDSFITYECIIWVTMVGLGLVFTSASTMAMDAGRSYTGAASAMVGAIGFLIGGIVSPIVGIGDILVTTSIVFTISATLALFLSFKVYNRSRGARYI